MKEDNGYTMDDIYGINVNKVKQRKKVKFGRFLLLLAIIAFVAIGTSHVMGVSNYKEVEFEIPMGASTKQISSILKDNDLIRSKILFQISTKVNGFGGKYRYGVYKMNTHMSTKEIMIMLSTEGATKDSVTVTIPEGYTVKQIGEKLEEAGLFAKEEFYNACKNTKAIYPFLDYSIKGDYVVEGYLFPNTYEFYLDATPDEVIEIMLESFNDNFDEADIEKAKMLGYTYNEVIRVASIIEREVKEPSERPMVAGVVYNRLKQNMALQMCSTIQYILGEQHDKLYNEDLEIESPYNTYKYPGLPVGPISNPGKASIDAALNPEVHDYLYFVLMDEKTGKHYFSKTFEEHAAAKAKYIK
ncbi:MAG: endolytic transglycosylase MltG [Clostridia bacterium]|nr:endolytic transglycosylase MltG [Clostridia bacterium]